MKGFPWHVSSTDVCSKRLKTDPARGLTSDEAKRRLEEFGRNLLAGRPRVHPLRLFFKQFSDFMVLVLLGAGAISFFLGETVDAIAIGAILALNAVFGFIQEYRAERSLEALKELTAPTATVIRDGKRQQIGADTIVPGDILLIKSGDRIPADGRLLWSMSLEVDQSPFTGESIPVRKDAAHQGTEAEEPADRANMVYMGTAVTRGRARVLVTATGMNTQIGEIAEMIRSSEEEATPLQRRLQQLGKWLVLVCAVLVLSIVLGGIARGLPLYMMFLIGVSLAVAAIPEGLPAVVTASLALGVQRMIRRNAIVRRLPSVETLGCATVICTDKTGTLTKNEMTLTRLYMPDGTEVHVTGIGYEPVGSFKMPDQRPIDPREHPDMELALRIGVLCNASEVMPSDENKASKKKSKHGANAWRVSGDPTEGALLVAGLKGGLQREHLERRYPVLLEHPFDPARRRMSVIVRDGRRYLSLVKGAPAAVLQQCTHYQINGESQPLTAAMRRRIERQTEAYAEQALRVLAFAYRQVPAKETGLEAAESGLTFVGLAAMLDPPRDEVKAAIMRAHRAGIRTIMLTGDHPATALAIGRMVHLLGSSDSVVTGREIEAMDDKALSRCLETTRCFARVSPKHKLRIVRALRQAGEIVAMTGDGVNDAPAVKEADIGISMGKTGADVTKEASALVLADDNFATIVAAVEEGRGIYENIRKFIRYLLGCNAGEVFAMLAAVLVGLPLPLQPLQILWMNLVTDGLPALALGIDPPEKDIMNRPPRPADEGIFSRRLHWKILFSGLMIGGSTVAAFVAAIWLRPEAIDWARTIAFTTLVTSQLLFAFSCRSEHRTAIEAGILGNRYLVGAVIISFAMQLAVIYWPPVTAVFRTVPLSWYDWVLVGIFSAWGQVLSYMVTFLRQRFIRRFSVVRVG